MTFHHTFLLLLASLAVSLAMRDYSGYKVFRITPLDESSLHYLRSLEFEAQYDFWSDLTGVGHSVDIMVSEDRRGFFISKLEEMGMTITTMIDDVQALIDAQMQRPSADEHDFYEYYHTLDEILDWMDDFSFNHPQLVRTEQCSSTYEGRTVEKLKISSDFNANKPIFFMIGGTHSREWVTQATMMRVAKTLVDAHENGDGDLLEYMDFHIVPVFNQDGYDFTWKEDRLWRKTRRPNENSRFGCVGTDPNRNWSYKWGTGGSSNFPCSNTYMGPFPASEVEIWEMQTHILSIKDRVKVFMDVHAYSQFWMYPFGYSYDLPRDEVELRAASDAAVAAVEACHGKKYKNGPIAEVIYVASGSSADWGYAVADIKHSYALELRDTGDEYGFLLPDSQIKPTAEEFFAGCEALVYYLRDNDGLY